MFKIFCIVIFSVIFLLVFMPQTHFLIMLITNKNVEFSKHKRRTEISDEP